MEVFFVHFECGMFILGSELRQDFYCVAPSPYRASVLWILCSHRERKKVLWASPLSVALSWKYKHKAAATDARGYQIGKHFVESSSSNVDDWWLSWWCKQMPEGVETNFLCHFPLLNHHEPSSFSHNYNWSLFWLAFRQKRWFLSQLPTPPPPTTSSFLHK